MDTQALRTACRSPNRAIACPVARSAPPPLAQLVRAHRQVEGEFLVHIAFRVVGAHVQPEHAPPTATPRHAGTGAVAR